MNTTDQIVGQSIGARIRHRRQQLGMSQQELLAGHFSEAYLSRVEQNHIKPSPRFLAYVANRLHTSLSDLLAPETTPARPSLAELELDLSNAYTAYLSGNYEQARQLLFDFNARAQGVELPAAVQARYYRMLGTVESLQGDNEAALLDLKQALEILLASPRSEPLEIGQVRNSIGVTYYQQANYVMALEQHRRCLDDIQQGLITDSFFKLKIYQNLANDYQCLGNTKQALQLYRQAARQADEQNDGQKLAAIYWGMALSYRSAGNLAMAKIYFNKSAVIYETREELTLASTVKSTLGVALLEQADYSGAEEVLVEAYQIALRLNDNRVLSKARTNLAYLCFLQRRISEAELHALEGVSLARVAAPDDLLLSQGLAQLADVRIAQQRFEEGLALYREAVETLEQPGQGGEFLTRIYARYASALEKAGHLNRSVEMFRKAFKLKENPYPPE